MRLKLDENLPLSLVAALATLKHEVDTVRDEGLTGCSDAAVWEAAQKERRFFVTQDLDFADTRHYVPGTHNGLLIVRLRDGGAESLFERVIRVFTNESVHSWNGCTVVVTDRKVRVHGPMKL